MVLSSKAQKRARGDVDSIAAVAETTTTEIKHPEWAQYRKKNGLDSPGMQNSSISLYQEFLSGVSNVTLRMRSDGFHAWLRRTLARRIGSTNPEDWKCLGKT